MMKTKPNFNSDSASRRRSNNQRDGFTFVDLLAILAVVALLMVLEVSAYAGAKERTKVAMCASNLRQLTLALHLYANDNNNKLPILTGTANWAWDLPWNVGETLLSYNLQPKTFYCPGTSPRFTDEDNLALWNFSPGPFGFHVIGYALALSGSASHLVVSNQNTTILAEPIKTSTIPIVPTLPPPPNSERVLVADATISSEMPAPGTTTYSQRLSYDYTYVYGGFGKPHLSPHLNGNIPQGGNLGFKDGHIAWRKFEDMDQRATSGIGFWW